MILCDIWTEEIGQKSTFPEDLKDKDVTLIFKKDSPLVAENYRPVSVLPAVSKIFERLMQEKDYRLYKLISLSLVIWI